MEERDVCLSEHLKPDVCERIITCKAQMERFDPLCFASWRAPLFPHR